MEENKIKKQIISNPSLISFSKPATGKSFGFVKNHIHYGNKIDEQLTYDENQEPKITALEKQGYQLNERTFSSITPLFSDDYKKAIFPYFSTDGVYLGAEHCNKDSSINEILQKKCNLTFFNNLEAKLGDHYVQIMASSMGHFHPSKLKVQEIYEFQGYGAMVIQKEGEKPNLIFMNPGGKVIVPGQCHMTIYSLQLEPLETHDFANPKQNSGHKNIQKQKGPIFLIHHDDLERRIYFKINSQYSKYHPSDHSVSLTKREWKPLGELLFLLGRNKSFKKQFEAIGVNLLRCDDIKLPRFLRNKKLKDLVKEKSQEFCSLFNLKDGN